MSSIIYFGSIFLSKVLDNALSTTKTILIQSSRWLLAIAEKPSVARSIANVIGAYKREDGYLEGSGYIVSWCVGHLVELAQPQAYDERLRKWCIEDLPILPDTWKY